MWSATHSKSVLLALRGHVWSAALRLLRKKGSGAERAKQERTEMNQFPLHVAVEEGAPSEVVRLLLDLYPKAASRRSKFSFWVLGTKTRVGRWRAPVSMLVGPKELERHGHMPMHTAAAVGASSSVIEMLASTDAGVLQQRARGLLPLHVALYQVGRFFIYFCFVFLHPPSRTYFRKARGRTKQTIIDICFCFFVFFVFFVFFFLSNPHSKHLSRLSRPY